MSVLDALRTATAPLHDELESGSRLVDRLCSPGDRPAVLVALLGLYVAAEAALAPHLLPVPDLEFGRRRKAGALRAGLLRLGVTRPAAPPPGPGHPAIAGVREALGFAYVLEGATLGGRIVRRQVARTGMPLDGLAFFDFYGPDTGRFWQRFCQVLERECATEPQAAVTGACAGFAFMAQGLLPAAGEPAAGCAMA
ncbi:MAG: biliverdin-producing heme oxygenase [Sneathiellaceae bacterium]